MSLSLPSHLTPLTAPPVVETVSGVEVEEEEEEEVEDDELTLKRHLKCCSQNWRNQGLRQLYRRPFRSKLTVPLAPPQTRPVFGRSDLK